MSLLDSINGPADLKALTRDELPALAEEVRARLIDCVLGHRRATSAPASAWSSSPIALLYEFDSPTDKIVWDVGHQAYAWKLLTGRNAAVRDAPPDGRDLRLPQAQRERARPVRRRPRRHRDVGGARHGHGARPQGRGPTRSSPSSATARSPAASPTKGMNNAGHSDRDIILVVNDNGMSISPNVGAISRTLGGIVATPDDQQGPRAVKGFTLKMSHVFGDGRGRVRQEHRGERQEPLLRGDALRGAGLPVLRPDRRARPQEAGRDASPSCGT